MGGADHHDDHKSIATRHRRIHHGSAAVSRRPSLTFSGLTCWFLQPVGAELVIHVCDLGVFVYQPAEQIPTSEMKVAMAMSQVTAADELFGTHRLPAVSSPRR
jgi:hypothetical protein